MSSTAGAGIGAWLAFIYADRHRKEDIADRAKEDRQHEYEKMCIVLYVLMSRGNSMKSFERQFFNEERTGFVPGRNLIQTLMRLPEAKVSYYDLSPLIRGQYGDLLSEITVAESAYFNWSDALEQRNLMAARLGEMLRAMGVRPNRPMGKEAAVRAAPEIEELVALNTEFVDTWRNAHHRNANITMGLASAINQLFPELPRIVPVETPPGQGF